MARATSRITGTLRSALEIPPGPTLSPTVCRIPYRDGISMSWRMLANPPTEKVAITYSAPRERVVDVGGGPGRERDSPALGDVLDDLDGGWQRVGVEVVEDQLGVGQGRGVGEVHRRASVSSGCFLHRRV